MADSRMRCCNPAAPCGIDTREGGGRCKWSLYRFEGPAQAPISWDGALSPSTHIEGEREEQDGMRQDTVVKVSHRWWGRVTSCWLLTSE